MQNETKINSTEFIARGLLSRELFIGANLEGYNNCVAFITRLEKLGLECYFLDNKSQTNFSDTLWFRCKNKKLSLSKDQFCELMLLRPDECSVTDDGFVRLWWD